MRIRVALGIIVIQALLSYLAWPNWLLPEPNWFSALIIFLVPAPMFFFIQSSRGKEAFFLQGLSGMAIFLPAGFYVTQIHYFPPLFGWMIWLLVGIIVFLMTSSVSLFSGILYRYFRWGFILLAPTVFETIEFLRVLLSEHIWFFPLPNGILAYPLVGVPPLIQMASFTGVYGPEFLILFIAGVVALISWEILLRWPRGRKWFGISQDVQPLERKSQYAALGLGSGIAVMLLILIITGNLEAMGVAKQQAGSARSLRPALLQSNFDPSQMFRWKERQQLVINTYRKMAWEAAEQGAQLLVFTENAVRGTLPENRDLWDDLREICKEVKLPAIVGLITKVDEKNSFNVWYHINQKGEIKNYYAKQFLVPFGEYLPMRSVIDPIISGINFVFNKTYRFLRLTAIEQNNYDLCAGRQEKIFKIGDQNIIIKVCDELLYAKYFRNSVRLGGEVVLSPAAGNWFKTPEYFYNYMMIACFRAVETRRWVARVVSMNGSFYVDALGIVRAKTAFNRQSVHVQSMPLLTMQTFYVKYGDVFGWLCLLVTMVFGILAGVSTFRESKHVSFSKPRNA